MFGLQKADRQHFAVDQRKHCKRFANYISILFSFCRCIVFIVAWLNNMSGSRAEVNKKLKQKERQKKGAKKDRLRRVDH